MRTHAALIFLLAVACWGPAAVSSAAGTVVFRDDFDGPPGMPDRTMWLINHEHDRNHISDWWVQGRTFFPCPVHHTSPWIFPYLGSGYGFIEHHHYNAYDLGTPKTTFLGGEIRSATTFDPGNAYCVEARVFNGAYPDGLVTSFFLYGYDGAHSDEIDFEFVSKQTNNDAAYPDSDPVLTNTWDESQQNPSYRTAEGLNLTGWNTFRIYWYPNLRTEWTWADPARGETLLRVHSGPSVPDEPMALFFNFWAPRWTWSDAYDPNLQPVQLPEQDVVYSYAIDYAEVRTIAPLLVWNGAEDQWGSGHWYDGWQNRSPQGDERMLVQAGRVDVDAEYSGTMAAESLEIEAGTLDVGPAGRLDVLQSVTADDGTELVVDGTLAAADVSVAGTLTGNGSMSAAIVTVSGRLAPGSASAPPGGAAVAGLDCSSRAASVPEPSALLLAVGAASAIGAAGAVATGLAGRRRRRGPPGSRDGPGRTRVRRVPRGNADAP